MATSLDLAHWAADSADHADMTGWCQNYAGECWERAFNRPTPNSYPTATAAYNASDIQSFDWDAAPPCAFHYFDLGGPTGDGHVGMALGSGYMVSATGWSSYAVDDLGKNIYVHRVADYAGHLKYLGWSLTNGDRAQITGFTNPYVTSSGGGDDMPIFAAGNIIVWPNGYCAGYSYDVWEACRLAAAGDTTSSRVNTLVRESWNAARFIENETAALTISMVPPPVSDEHGAHGHLRLILVFSVLALIGAAVAVVLSATR